MTKLRVQAQHLQAGDIVGSSEKVRYVIQNSINFPSNKCMVVFEKTGKIWGKTTMIRIERVEKVEK